MVRIRKGIGAGVLLCGLALLVPNSAHAAPVFCAAQPAGGLDETDVTFRTVAANDCYGVVTNPGNPFVGGAASGWTVNTLLGGLFGGGWDATVKDDGAVGTLSNYLGINWTLSAPQQAKTGSWSLSLADPGPVSLPVTVDMLVILKASDRWAAYLFNAQTFNLAGSNSGTFAINFLNNGGKIPGLSNMQVYFRPGTAQVPEPATLMIMSLGALGAAMMRRRVLAS
jgi:hypothetical protein